MKRSRDIPDHADEKWRYSEHAAAKHEILRRYLGAWLPILGTTSPTAYVYDGFAGRGRYIDGEPGSPLIAHQRAVEAVHNGRPQRAEVRCVEADPRNFAQLAEEIEDVEPHPRVAIRAKRSTFDRAANELADRVQERRARDPGWSPPPMLFLADPFGFRGVPLATVERLMAIPRAEILITFMVRDQRRFLNMENVAAPLTELFGGPDWKACANAEDSDRCLVRTYREAILRRGIARYPTSFQVFEDARAQTLYYLIHLTNDPLGMREMKKAMVKTSPEMTFWPVTVRPRDQLALELAEEAPFPTLQRHLVSSYAGQRMTFETLLNTDFPSGTWLEPDYRVAVKDLDRAADTVVVHRDRPPTPTGKAPRGLELGDVIEFPASLPPGEMTATPLDLD